MNRIAVFDSGLGGLTVLKTLREHFPQADYFYLGDTARLPYGSKSPEVVKRYALECAQFLSRFNPDALIVACNTASSLALELLEKEFSFPVIGMIDPVVEHVFRVAPRSSVAVLGTKATIASGAYQKKLSEVSPTVSVHAKACPLFVPFVEEGVFTGPLIEGIIDLYLSSLRTVALDTLILGCTHYPLLHDQLAAYFGGHVEIVECGQGVLSELAKLPISRSERKGTAQFFVTDDVTSFSHLASLFLGNPPQVEKVELTTFYESAVGW
ncbi:MAG: glutamate racemase [Bdellovibrionales bacterium]|nr:glutamate racemase [Bdellovibrionales bacterium]